jgi:hypothetical protein
MSEAPDFLTDEQMNAPDDDDEKTSPSPMPSPSPSRSQDEAPEFLTDEEMNAPEPGEKQPVDHAPEFLTDEQMNAPDDDEDENIKEQIGTAAEQVASGATLGLSKKLESNSEYLPFPFNAIGFGARLAGADLSKEGIEKREEKYPGTTLAANLAGGVGSALATGGFGAEALAAKMGGSLGARLAAQALTSAAAGGASAGINSDEKDASQLAAHIGTSALWSGAAGLAGQGVAEALTGGIGAAAGKLEKFLTPSEAESVSKGTGYLNQVRSAFQSLVDEMDKAAPHGSEAESGIAAQIVKQISPELLFMAGGAKLALAWKAVRLAARYIGSGGPENAASDLHRMVEAAKKVSSTASKTDKRISDGIKSLILSTGTVQKERR